MIANRLSVIIPNRNCQFTTRTIQDLLEKATGDVEVVVSVDEQWPEPLVNDKRVTYIHPGSPQGMRAGINSAVALAKGEFVMKTDDHCMFAPGYDEALKKDCADNWIVIPSRYSLDAENWKIEENGKDRRDYHYLCYPQKGKAHDDGMHGVEWWERGRERRDDPKYDIDDTPSFQGSCWFMKRAWFTNFLKGMSETGYGQFAQETQELGMKTWFGGGEVKVNKKTWYAHLHKGNRYGRMYQFDDSSNKAAINWSAEHWMKGEEPGMIHDIAWFVEEKFPGMPTWEPNWRDWYK